MKQYLTKMARWRLMFVFNVAAIILYHVKYPRSWILKRWNDG